MKPLHESPTPGALFLPADAAGAAKPPIPTSRASDIAGLAAAVASAQPVPLSRTWTSGCATGSVRVAWCPQAIIVRADLHDDDVFTRAGADSQQFWKLGDTFEIFFEASGSGFYTEMHVAPGNFRLHLRIRHDDLPGIASKVIGPADLMVRPPGFRSRFEAFPGGWIAEAVIPADAVDPAGTITERSSWTASFSRYDAFRDGRRPALSSTSNHSKKKPNFHARDDWRPLCF